MSRFLVAVGIITMGFVGILFTTACDWFCGPSGCFLGVATVPPATSPPKVIDHVDPNFDDFNNQTLGAVTPCFITTTSHVGTWNVYYQGEATPHPEERWYAFSKSARDGSIAINDSALTSDWKPFGDAAVQVWAATLSDPANLKTPDSYYALTPVSSTDPSAPIQMVRANDLPRDEPGTTFGAIDPQNWAYISLMRVRLNQQYVPATYDQRYVVALHELGHGLGLAHNKDIGSIMFPKVDSNESVPTDCYQYNGASAVSSTHPKSKFDTDALENHYDPTFVRADNGGGCGRGVVCPQAKRRKTAAGSSVAIAPRKTMTTREILAPAAKMRGVSDAGRFYFSYQDSFSATKASAAELLTNSSLVIVGRVVGKRVLHTAIDESDVLQSIAVERVVSAEGPDTTVAPNSMIEVSDLEFAGGDAIDQPSLKRGERVVLFLVRNNDPFHARFARVSYRSTYRYISRWNLDPQGRLTMRGLTRAKVQSEIEGRVIDDVFGAVSPASGVRSTSSRLAPLSRERVLVSRGIVTPSDRARYTSLLFHDPIQLVKDSNRRAGRPGVVW